MVGALRELFAKSKEPSHEDKESAVQSIVTLLEQAQVIGHEHARSEAETQERGMAWGGNFGNLLQSAWDIVSNFVQRIGDWITDQDEVSEQDIIDQVDGLADTVASFEIPSVIEGAVMDELQQQNFLEIQWYVQPGACERCLANAAQGAIPIGTAFADGSNFPPAHSRCQCSLGAPE